MSKPNLAKRVPQSMRECATCADFSMQNGVGYCVEPTSEKQLPAKAMREDLEACGPQGAWWKPITFYDERPVAVGVRQALHTVH